MLVFFILVRCPSHVDDDNLDDCPLSVNMSAFSAGLRPAVRRFEAMGVTMFNNVDPSGHFSASIINLVLKTFISSLLWGHWRDIAVGPSFQVSVQRRIVQQLQGALHINTTHLMPPSMSQLNIQAPRARPAKVLSWLACSCAGSVT